MNQPVHNTTPLNHPFLWRFSSSAFTGKERDEETGYGYFGARYYDADLTTGWLSVDPMSDKYPGVSLYAYCAWNPVKLVDPDGREVYITGGAAEQATKQLSSKRITISRDGETGKLSYSINDPKGKLSTREKMLVQAIDDNTVCANIYASSKSEYVDRNGNRLNNTQRTGQFLGVDYLGDAESYRSISYQLVNPSNCETRDKECKVSNGVALCHEITESYQACLRSKALKQSEGPAYDQKNGHPVNVNSPIYNYAHRHASIQPNELQDQLNYWLNSFMQ